MLPVEILALESTGELAGEHRRAAAQVQRSDVFIAPNERWTWATHILPSTNDNNIK